MRQAMAVSVAIGFLALLAVSTGGTMLLNGSTVLSTAAVRKRRRVARIHRT